MCTKISWMNEKNKMLVWICSRKKKGYINQSWQASMKVLPYSFFVLFSFVLKNVFLFWYNGIIILCIVEVIGELHMNFTLIELKLGLTWKLLKICFETQIEFFLL